MSVSSMLNDLICKKRAYHFYCMQQIYWADQYTTNSAKLQDQTKAQSKWESAYDKAMEGSSECKVNGYVFVQKDQGAVSESVAEAFANAKVSQYDEALSLDLASKDMDYDGLKTLYETLTTEMKAQIDSEQQQLATEAQDTHKISS